MQTSRKCRIPPSCSSMLWNVYFTFLPHKRKWPREELTSGPNPSQGSTMNAQKIRLSYSYSLPHAVEMQYCLISCRRYAHVTWISQKPDQIIAENLTVVKSIVFLTWKAKEQMQRRFPKGLLTDNISVQYGARWAKLKHLTTVFSVFMTQAWSSTLRQ